MLLDADWCFAIRCYARFTSLDFGFVHVFRENYPMTPDDLRDQLLNETESGTTLMHTILQRGDVEVLQAYLDSLEGLEVSSERFATILRQKKTKPVAPRWERGSKPQGTSDTVFSILAEGFNIRPHRQHEDADELGENLGAMLGMVLPLANDMLPEDDTTAEVIAPLFEPWILIHVLASGNSQLVADYFGLMQKARLDPEAIKTLLTKRQRLPSSAKSILQRKSGKTPLDAVFEGACAIGMQLYLSHLEMLPTEDLKVFMSGSVPSAIWLQRTIMTALVHGNVDIVMGYLSWAYAKQLHSKSDIFFAMQSRTDGGQTLFELALILADTDSKALSVLHTLEEFGFEAKEWEALCTGQIRREHKKRLLKFSRRHPVARPPAADADADASLGHRQRSARAPHRPLHMASKNTIFTYLIGCDRPASLEFLLTQARQGQVENRSGRAYLPQSAWSIPFLRMMFSQLRCYGTWELHWLQALSDSPSASEVYMRILKATLADVLPAEREKFLEFLTVFHPRANANANRDHNRNTPSAKSGPNRSPVHTIHNILVRSPELLGHYFDVLEQFGLTEEEWRAVFFARNAKQMNAWHLALMHTQSQWIEVLLQQARDKLDPESYQEWICSKGGAIGYGAPHYMLSTIGPPQQHYRGRRGMPELAYTEDVTTRMMLCLNEVRAAARDDSELLDLLTTAGIPGGKGVSPVRVAAMSGAPPSAIYQLLSEIRQISDATYKEHVCHGLKRWANKADAPRSRLRIADSYFADVRETDVNPPSGLAFAFLNSNALSAEDGTVSAPPAPVTTRRRMDGTFTNTQVYQKSDR